MRVAFDLDDLLIPGRRTFPLDPPVAGPLRFWFRERFRQGTRALLRELRVRGVDVWVYTTSGRDPTHLRLRFLVMGVWLGGIVNCRHHEQLRHTRQIPSCSKYPPYFQIDLLVDDSEGVALEGKRHGFAVLVISPDDTNWPERVLQAVPVPSPRASV